MVAGPTCMSQKASGEQEFRHRDSNPGRLDEGRVFQPARLYRIMLGLETLHEPLEFRTTATLCPIIQEL
jgi:hypothetical protein